MPSRPSTVPQVDDDVFRVLTRTVPDVGVLHVGTTYDVVTESASDTDQCSGLDHPGPGCSPSPRSIWWLVGRHPATRWRTSGWRWRRSGPPIFGRRVPRPGTKDEIDRLAATMNEMLARLETSVEPPAAIRRRRLPRAAQPADPSPLRVGGRYGRGGSRRTACSAAGLLEEVLGMQVMVEDLLFLARSDAGQANGTFRSVDLDDLVLEEAKRIQSHQRVEIDLSAVSGAQVIGDPGQLTRAIRNLMDNAERHAASRVELSLQESGEDAVLVVADDGPGIPDQEATRIFERFTRLDEARTAGAGGTGLGLAISREIVERHQGSLTLLPTDGSGARFQLKIPLVPDLVQDGFSLRTAT